jgi:hypothetical protein
MSTIDELRLKIFDWPQLILNEHVGDGNGSTADFKIAQVPILPSSAVVLINGVPKVETLDYTLDYSSGRLTFIDPPEQDEVITASYDFAAFTDPELQSFLDRAGGNLAMAAGEALSTLASDRSRLVTWARGDMRIDYDQLRRDLNVLAIRFLEQGGSESGARIDDIDWEEVV